MKGLIIIYLIYFRYLLDSKFCIQLTVERILKHKNNQWIDL